MVVAYPEVGWDKDCHADRDFIDKYFVKSLIECVDIKEV